MNQFQHGAEPLNREHPMPLWAQLEQELRRRLEAGDFARRFPTDRELMETYEVSRHTARHAVGQLGSHGILRRARGVGTSIDTQTFERSLGALYSLFQVVEEAGVEQRSEVRRLERVIDPLAAARLEMEPTAELVLLDRLRYAGSFVLAIDRIWLPADAAEPLLDVDFTRTSLYDELENATGRRPKAGWERIHATVPSPSERKALELPADAGVFVIERLGRCDDRPVEWRSTVIRGDRFAFIADWSTGQRSELRPRLI